MVLTAPYAVWYSVLYFLTPYESAGTVEGPVRYSSVRGAQSSGSAAPLPFLKSRPSTSVLYLQYVCTPYSVLLRNGPQPVSWPGQYRRVTNHDRTGGCGCFGFPYPPPPLSRATLQSHASSTSGAEFPTLPIVSAVCVRSVPAIVKPQSLLYRTCMCCTSLRFHRCSCLPATHRILSHPHPHPIPIPSQSHPIPSHPPFPPASRHPLRPSGCFRR